MPWKETDKMEQKELFIKAMLANEKPFKHLCADFGISEKTGHKWKNRFYEQGKAGLYEQSRARLTYPPPHGTSASTLADYRTWQTSSWLDNSCLREALCQDDFCLFSKINGLFKTKSPDTSCLQMS